MLWGCPVQCRIFSSIPGLYSPDASSSLLPVVTSKTVPGGEGGKIVSVEKLWSQVSIPDTPCVDWPWLTRYHPLPGLYVTAKARLLSASSEPCQGLSLFRPSYCCSSAWNIPFSPAYPPSTHTPARHSSGSRFIISPRLKRHCCEGSSGLPD